MICQYRSRDFDSGGGYCVHEAWVENGRVFLANDDDSHYRQDFINRQEIQDFIDHLWDMADEAWPNP